MVGTARNSVIDDWFIGSTLPKKSEVEKAAELGPAGTGVNLSTLPYVNLDHQIETAKMARAGNIGLAFDCVLEFGCLGIEAKKLLHATGHLLSNAITFTGPGGQVPLTAKKSEAGSRFRLPTPGAA